jgi:hypothetical protein
MKYNLVFLLLISCKNLGCISEYGCFPKETDPHYFANRIQEIYPNRFDRDYLLRFYKQNEVYFKNKNTWLIEKVKYFEKKHYFLKK